MTLKEDSLAVEACRFFIAVFLVCILLPTMVVSFLTAIVLSVYYAFAWVLS